jgi:hypothetical protein
MTAILPPHGAGNGARIQTEIIAHSRPKQHQYYSVILSQPTLGSERASVQGAVLGWRGVMQHGWAYVQEWAYVKYV